MRELLNNLSLMKLLLIVILFTSCAGSVNQSNTAGIESNRIEKETVSQNKPIETCVNVNTAGLEDLMRLPGVGEVTARKIIEYRERNGEFRRKEEIIIIDGFSEKKYRDIADKICVD